MQHPEEQEDKEEFEDVEDEEFIDEDYEENGERRSRIGFGPTGKTVTLQMLLSAEILSPGEGTMAIEYLGQRFIGDLLPDGKIKSQETDIVFASPSAWAIHCKRIINPEKKSGCGWASVKYRGRKLDAYKNVWFKKKKQERNKENEGDDEANEEMERDRMNPPPPIQQRTVLKHHALASRSITHDPNILVESTPFSTMGKIQPFLVSMATNAVLVMDFHCHLTTSEVVGYLAGHWDVNAHNLAITHAFPCRSRLADRELAPMVEADIYRAIEQRHLTLVGWYHSHPYAPATPTLRDIDSQLDYQIKMKGNSDASYTPCVGVICSPYNQDSASLESVVVSYWVMPPPESKPHDYGKSMLMSYSVVQDQFLSQDSLNEMKRCVDFYKKGSDFVKFVDKYKGNITYLDKLKHTLSSKFPRDQSDGILWGFIRDLVSQDTELPDIPNAVIAASDRVNLLVPVPAAAKTNNLVLGSDMAASDRVNLLVPVPAVAKTNNLVLGSDMAASDRVNLMVPVPTAAKTNNLVLGSDMAASDHVNLLVPVPATTKTNNLVLGSDIANALFATGKFPSASSLMGLPSDSVNTNDLSNVVRSNSNLPLSSPQLSNMFLSPMSFNMDSMSILSSMSNANSLPSTSKASDLSVPPTDAASFATPENFVVTSG